MQPFRQLGVGALDLRGRPVEAGRGVGGAKLRRARRPGEDDRSTRPRRGRRNPLLPTREARPAGRASNAESPLSALPYACRERLSRGGLVEGVAGALGVVEGAAPAW
jgi:hypothetical protein